MDVTAPWSRCSGNRGDTALRTAPVLRRFGRFCAVTRLWKSYYCFNFFWNLTLGWACSTVFIVMCREDCFCVHYVKKFLFLVAIMSFNLWETNVKKKKLKRWDQIKVNNVTPCDLILGPGDCDPTLIYILLHWFNSLLCQTACSARSFIRWTHLSDRKDVIVIWFLEWSDNARDRVNSIMWGARGGYLIWRNQI